MFTSFLSHRNFKPLCPHRHAWQSWSFICPASILSQIYGDPVSFSHILLDTEASCSQLLWIRLHSFSLLIALTRMFTVLRETPWVQTFFCLDSSKHFSLTLRWIWRENPWRCRKYFLHVEFLDFLQSQTSKQ